MDGAKDEQEFPEEFAQIEREEVKAAFRALNDRQKSFITEYIRCHVGSEAYRRSYNPMADDVVAASCASRALTNANIKVILTAFNDFKEEDFFLVRKTFVNAAKNASKPIFGKDELGQPILVLEQEDHDVRVKAATNLAKLHGHNAAEKVTHDASEDLRNFFSSLQAQK